MNIANIKYTDIANGPGVRTSLFVAGCRLHCPGCFNSVAWDFSAGEPLDDKLVNNIAASLEPHYIAGLSVLGGEPMEPENQAGLAPLLEELHARFPHKSIWLYSGHTFEELCDACYIPAYTERIFNVLDVLVDGPFVARLKDPGLQFRGSSNQRLIDMPATLARNEVVLWEDPQNARPI